MSGTTDTGTVIGVLLRITWMLAGHIMTAISAIYIIRETKTYYSVWGVVFWSIPLFKARCHSVGRNLKLPNGIPLVIGSQLKIILGNNVTIGRSTIGSSKVFDHPLLTIGDNSTINYGTVISVAKEIVIGHDCMISGNCLIMDSDDHPLSPRMRLMKAPVAMQDVKPVRIGNNVWIGAYATILKGVTIGDNTVVGAHSVVTRDLPPNSVAVGIPARVAMTGIDKGDVE